MPIFRLFALLVCTLLAACGQHDGPREAAEKFFTLCSNGKAPEAYQSAATVFQLEKSPKYFEARIRELSLHRVKEMQWGAMNKRGNAFVIPIQFIIPDEQPLALNVSMIEENGQWRVLDARRATEEGSGEDVFRVVSRSADGSLVNSSKVFTEPVAPVLPTNEQLQKLVEDALMKFDASVKAGDFTTFYDYVSDRWKYRGKDPSTIKYVGNDPSRIKASDMNNQDQRLTKAALDRAFKPFIDAQVDMRPIKGKKMLLDEPAYVNTDGVLVLKGGFDGFVFTGSEPPKPKKVIFRMEFVLEAATWKVFGISVSLK